MLGESTQKAGAMVERRRSRWGGQSRFRVILKRDGVEFARGLLLAYDEEEAKQDGFFVLTDELFDETVTCYAEQLDD